MKRIIFAAMLAVLCLAGCAKGEDSFRVDTVVYIPADPTVAATEPAEQEIQPETEIPMEAVTEPETTEPEETEATEPEETTTTKKTSTTSKKNNTSSKKPSSGKDKTESKPTEPIPTETSPTEAPVPEPVPTEQPAATETPATEPEPTDPPLYDISGYSVGSLEYAIKDAINAYRAGEGLDELSISSRLCAIASCRGYEISQVWSHTRPDGRSYKTVLSDYGYGGSAKELLVYVSGSGDGAAIVDKWMASDSHRELLMGSFSTVGIGVYRANGYTYVACLLVG